MSSLHPTLWRQNSYFKFFGPPGAPSVLLTCHGFSACFLQWLTWQFKANLDICLDFLDFFQNSLDTFASLENCWLICGMKLAVRELCFDCKRIEFVVIPAPSLDFLQDRMPYNKYLINLTCLVRTVRYGSSFFPLALWPARFAKEKTPFITYGTDRAYIHIYMYIYTIYLLYSTDGRSAVIGRLPVHNFHNARGKNEDPVMDRKMSYARSDC